ncbi:hypothetical protein [Kocuria marina]|uniref:hypothetical protein n=1 Tax=Kocuria marina TaxID=223184 RepID=UPI0021A7395F|nr:hypothetical protein [Kocuria marina]MCT1615782.1 hypothetical protein [Kocuria marina]
MRTSPRPPVIPGRTAPSPDPFRSSQAPARSGPSTSALPHRTLPVRRRALAILSTVLLCATACAGPQPGPSMTPAPEPTGPVPGVARNAPLHAVDPGLVAAARDLPETYPGSATRDGDPTARVTLGRASPGDEDYRHGSVGLSLESTDLADPRLGEDNDDLVSILQSLHEPTLRFGGNSTDRRFFFTPTDEPIPTDWPLAKGEKITKVTPADLERVAALARRTGTSVILSANLARYDPDRAADLAAHARAAFGDRLVGLMIGNEPNGFHRGSDDPLSVKGPEWNRTVYARQLTAYARAVHREVPHLRIVAPGAYSEPWWKAAAEAPDTAPMALALHQYPLSECGTRWPEQRPTVANAVSPGTRERVDSLVSSARSVADEHRVPLWITETSLSSCSGGNQITETLAAAVYQADYSMRVQALAAERVTAHSSLGPCHGGPPMSPLCSDGTVGSPGERFGLRANGLALALIASIPQGTMTPARTGSEDLTAFAVSHPDGSTSLVLSDFRDPATAGPRTTTVRTPAAVQRVTQSQLRGGSWRATAPVSEAANPHGASGSPSAQGTGTSTPGDAASYPADPRVALSVENALRPADRGAVSVDGYGLPITPPADRPEVAGVRPGATSFAVSLPAGTTTVLTIETKHATARPSAPASPSGDGTPAPKATPGVPRATTRSGGQ